MSSFCNCSILSTRSLRSIRSIRTTRSIWSARSIRSLRSIRPMSSIRPTQLIRPLSFFLPIRSTGTRAPGTGHPAPGHPAPGHPAPGTGAGNRNRCRSSPHSLTESARTPTEYTLIGEYMHSIAPSLINSRIKIPNNLILVGAIVL